MLQEFFYWYIGNIIQNPLIAIGGTVVAFFAAIGSVYSGVNILIKLIFCKSQFCKYRLLDKEIKKIRTGLDIQYLETILGKAQLITGLSIGYQERAYLRNNYDVQVIIDKTKKVIFYSISVVGFDGKVNHGWTPKVPFIEKRLSEIKFIDIGMPESIGYNVWGHMNYFYLEQFYFGRPGNYKDYYFQSSPISPHYDKIKIEEQRLLSGRTVNQVKKEIKKFYKMLKFFEGLLFLAQKLPSFGREDDNIKRLALNKIINNDIWEIINFSPNAFGILDACLLKDGKEKELLDHFLNKGIGVNRERVSIY